MNARPSVQTVALVVLVCIVAVFCFGQSSPGVVPVGANGRYQMLINGAIHHQCIVLLEVDSGRSWVRQLPQGVNKWQELGFPQPGFSEKAEKDPNAPV